MEIRLHSADISLGHAIHMDDRATIAAHMAHLLWDQTFVIASNISKVGVDSTCYTPFIERVLYTTIADECERPMKYVSGFCKISRKKCVKCGHNTPTGKVL
jgi:hypothetical protein